MCTVTNLANLGYIASGLAILGYISSRDTGTGLTTFRDLGSSLASHRTSDLHPSLRSSLHSSRDPG